MSLSSDPQHNKSQQPPPGITRSNSHPHIAAAHVHNPYHTLPSNSSLFIPNTYHPLPPMYQHMNHPNAVHNSSNMSPMPHAPLITNFPNHLSSFPSIPTLASYPNPIMHRSMSPQHVLPLINAATLHTIQRTDDLALNNQLMNHMHSAPQVVDTSPVTVQGDKDEIESIKTHNPWFNEEVASIVKLHRKTARKYHRSKTNKKELKEVCKKLEKKKRKLIKAAKQKYMEQIIAQKTVEEVQNIETQQNDRENKREEENITSGYLFVYVIQLIGDVLWSHWIDGTHWKVDVDAILDSDDDNNEESTPNYLYDWFKQMKNTGSEWRQWKSGNHWKVDVDDILESY